MHSCNTCFSSYDSIQGLTYIWRTKPGGPLVFKGGYYARVQKHGKRVVFHGEASAARPVFRVLKTAKIKKKGMFLRLNKKYVLRVYFLLTMQYVM